MLKGYGIVLTNGGVKVVVFSALGRAIPSLGRVQGGV